MDKWIEIDLKALILNAQAVKETAGVSKFMAVVKADAYGHGAARVVQALEEQGLSDAYGVWNLEEAKILKETLPVPLRGRKTPMALLAPSLEEAEALEWGVRHGIWFSVDREEAVPRLATAAAKVKKKAQIFLDLDMGLARWGIEPKHLNALASGILRSDHLQIAGIVTHLDYVPGLLKTEGETKLSKFLVLAKELSQKIKAPLIKSCANTSVFLDFPDWRLDMVRIGNLLYGINPTKTHFPVRNVWSFKARVASVRKLDRGTVIGYGGEYLVTKPMRVASIACGFADGFTMEPAHRFIRLSGPPAYYAKFKTKRLNLLGRPGLGHTLLDATEAPELKVGDVLDLPVRRTAAPTRIPRIYK